VAFVAVFAIAVADEGVAAGLGFKHEGEILGGHDGVCGIGRSRSTISAGAAQGSGAGCMQRLASKPAAFSGPSAGNFAAALHPEIAGLC